MSSSAARDPGERGSRRNCSTPANLATFPEDAMAQAVAPEAITGLIALLVSDAASAGERAILPADGAQSRVRLHTAPAEPGPVPGQPAPARGASR